MSVSTQQWADKYRRGRASLWAIDQRALAWLSQLRLMTTGQLQTVVAPELGERAMRASLARLAAAELADWVPLAPGRRAAPRPRRDPTRVWFLTGAGLAAAAPVTPRNYRITPEKAANHKQAHALAVSDTAIAFTRWLAAAGHEITPVDCEAEFAHMLADRGAQRFANLQVSDLRIRTLLTEGEDDIAVTRLIELDRGTESVQHLVDKVRDYARVLAYRGPGQRDKPDAGLPQWRYLYERFPKVIFVFADPAATLERTARRQEQFLALLAGERLLTRPLRELAISCTTLDLLQRQGPLAPIFTTLAAPDPVDLLGRRPATPPRAHLRTRTPALT